MIAPELLPQTVAPRPQPPQRSVRARRATRRRSRRARRRMHAPVLRVFALVLVVLLPLLLYVTLTSRLTSQNYALATVQRERGALVDETQRLDDRIARLQSPERLAALAAAMHLHDPHVYAVVRVPEAKPQPKPSGIAFLGAWLRGNK